MASVQFDGGKCHGATEAKAMIRHACADERVRHTHSNEDIDTERTCYNTDIMGLSYEEMCARYDTLIEGYRAAAAKALRKDAVTLFDAIISVPAGLSAEQEDAWYRDVAAVINTHYGKDVVLDIKIHRDEIHDYVDPLTHQTMTSRTHGHCFMVPDINGRLNGKKFSSRANMRALNREIDAMTRERYHCAFLTGEQTKDRGFLTVEQLKRASDAAELDRYIDEREEQYEHSKDRLDEIHRETSRATEQRDKVRRETSRAAEQRDMFQRTAEYLQSTEGVAEFQRALEREKRLKEFCRNIKYDNGKSVMDAFEEAERRRLEDLAKERRKARKRVKDGNER